MTRYKSEELGDVQKKILKHFFDCEERKPESVSHLSKELGVLQPSIYRSVELLIKGGYLLKNDKYTVGNKEIIVTPKGAATAVLLGITTNQLVRYFKKRKKDDSSATDAARYFEGFTRMTGIKNPPKQDLMVREMMEYLLKSDDFFNESGLVARNLTEEEKNQLMAFVAIKYHRAVGKPREIREVADKYGLDKNFLKEMLQREKEGISSLIRQLEG